MSCTRKQRYETQRECKRQHSSPARYERERTISRQPKDPRALDDTRPVTPINGLVQTEQPIAQNRIERSEILPAFVTPSTLPGHQPRLEPARSLLLIASAIDA